MKSKFYLASIIVLFLFILSCSVGSDKPEKTFICNAEKGNIETGRFYDEKDTSYSFKGYALRTKDEARSGIFSIKLNKDKQFGFGIRLKKLTVGEKYIISCWTKGDSKNVSLVVSGKNDLYLASNKILETDNKGWDLLSLEFIVPSNFIDGDYYPTYLYYSGKDAVYADDFKIEKFSK